MLLGLGTNLGDRAANVRAALDGLAMIGTIAAVSDVYETDPFGFAPQPPFWNLAVLMRAVPEPLPLIAALKALERRVGRTPSFRMGPRIIDIDLLLYGARRVVTPDLTVPHPGLLERRFVLRPLLDVAPAAVHPDGTRLDERLHELGDDGSVRRLGSARELLAHA